MNTRRFLKAALMLGALMTAGTPKAQTAEVTVTIHPDDRRQTLEGWGTSLCWWANVCGRWSEAKVNALVDLLVSPTGLNYNLFRYNIGGGDDPLNRNCTEHHMGAPGGKGLRAEMEGFKVYEESDYDWSRDEGQRRIMLKIKEKRPDAIFEAFSNSAPWWMTYSGCCAGNADAGKDNLKPEYYEAFARYLVDVCKHYKEEYGIEFRTLDPFNEPLTSYWNAGGSQEGCHFDASSQVAFLKVLAPMLKESGLGTRISASDETAVDQSLRAFAAYAADGEALQAVGQWNVHTYSADNAGRTKLRALVAERGLPLWMSETGADGEGLGGNLAMAQRLMDDMRYLMPDGWCDWQWVEPGSDQWGLVVADFDAQTYRIAKNYYVRQQITRFIKPGYTLLNTVNDQTLAALSPGRDSLVIVHLNNTDEAVEYCYDLSAFSQLPSMPCTGYATSEDKSAVRLTGVRVRDKKLRVKLPARSIQTYILKVGVGERPFEPLDTRADYMIVPRNGAYAAAAVDGGLALAAPDCTDDSQVWRLSARPDGGLYALETRGGLPLVNTGGYFLSTEAGAAGERGFAICPVADGYCYIREGAGERVFDLQGAVCRAGTRIGLYDLGEAATATTRQWLLVPFYDYALANGMSPVEQPERSLRVTARAGGLTVYNPLPGSPIYIGVYSVGGCRVAAGRCTGVMTDIDLSPGLYLVRVKGEDWTACRRVAVPFSGK